MKLPELDRPCVCGHLKGHHMQHPPEMGIAWTIFFHLCTIEACSCGDFKQDNVEYLRIVHESKRSKNELE